MQIVEILGVPLSPYTRKMLALLRFRHIPYRVIWGSHIQPPEGYPVPKIKLMPTVYLDTSYGKEALVDSTPIIDRLEDIYIDRLVRPIDEVLRFLDLLIEDFADEWVTKAMFHYRWSNSQDAANAGPLIAFGQNIQFDKDSAKLMSDSFSERQISRLGLVGSNPITGPVIEESFTRLLLILDRIIERRGFLLGDQPTASDFAIYGQLTQLGIIDPTSAQLLVRLAPRLRAWLDRVEDLSGNNCPGLINREEIESHIGELLHEIGRTYAPFLIANAKAYKDGKAEMSAKIDSQEWVQPVFPYQVKCLELLRQEKDRMSSEAQRFLDQILVGTGCEILFN